MSVIIPYSWLWLNSGMHTMLWALWPPSALTCAETPAPCCRHGWWQGPVCWMWCGRGKVTAWYCPDASTRESGPWRENEFWVRGWTAAPAPPSALEDTNPSALPGHNVQNCKENDKGCHCHQEPWENPCDHPNTEEHQDDILDEHLSLEGQAHIDWGNRKETSVRLWGSTNRKHGTQT